MASQPVEPPVGAQVDPEGRLILAESAILELQLQAGARLGDPLAVPQLAAVARLAMRLGVPIEREVLAATDLEDLQLWVRAEPSREGVSLIVERWTSLPPQRSRWVGDRGDPAIGDPAEADEEELLTDPGLHLTAISTGLGRQIGVDASESVGKPLINLLQFVEEEGGGMPLLEALSRRESFTGQPVRVRATGEMLLIDGEPRFGDNGFGGFTIRVRTPVIEAAPTAIVPMDDLLAQPLSSIIDQAQQIAARSEGPLRSDYAAYGSDIEAAARHLLDLLATLTPKPSPPSDAAGDSEIVDLAELVLEAAGLVQPKASERRIMLDVGGESRLPVHGSPRSITQILVNLIGNAVRFSPEGSSVTVTLRQGAMAEISVSDRGPGVPPSDRVRIFERFDQGSIPGEGAGLGLAISRRLAREMGGDVELVESAEGAVFRLSLPKA